MKKILFIFLFFLTTYANAEIVNKVEISGNKRISDETIKVYGEITLKENYDTAKINEIIKNLYETNFFENINVALKNGVLKIDLKEYPTINSIIINGEKAGKVKEKLLEIMTLKDKGSFINSHLNEDIIKIKKAYQSLGFNFVEVDAKIEEFTANRINLFFFIEKGEKTKISKINFIGDKRIKDRRLRDVIVSEENKFWKFLTNNTNLNYNNIKLDKRLISNYYKSIGYYDVQVLSSHAEISDTNLTELTFNINAGNRYRINKISTNVDPIFDKKYFMPMEKEFKKIIGKYYSPFFVTKLLGELDRLIASSDLQFVEHSVNEIVSDKSIEIKINVFEGSKQLVERVNVRGNSVTEESVIRSELLLDEGDPFSKVKLDQSIAKIKARRLFSSVKEKVLDGASKDQKIIEIEVEEQPTGEISAGAGFGTAGGSFGFDITENNWLGKGIKLSSFIAVDATSVKGAIEVKDPNFQYTGNELNYFISSTENDKPDSGFENTIFSSGVGVAFEQFKNIYLSPSLSLTHDDLSVNDTASAALKKQAGTFTDLTFKYGISTDNRDRAFMPTDGYISSFRQSFPIVADSSSLLNTYSLSMYNSLNPDIIGSFKFYASSVIGLNDDDVRISKRIFMPSSRLRGFEAGKVGPKDGADYVGGNYATAVNLETNLPNLLPENTKTDVGLFLDFGNIWGVDYSDSVSDSSKIRSSVGGNIKWSSPLGPMSFILSQNLSKANTDTTQSFNFRLGTTF